MRNKKLIIAVAVFVVIAGFSGWFIYRDLKKTQENGSPAPTAPAANEVNFEEQQAAALKRQEEIKKQMPDLDRKIVVTENLSTEVRLRAINDIGATVAILKEDYDRREEWLNLGLVYKLIGDYEGAKQAWEFTTLIRPEDPVAYHNLGDLYSQYLPDFSKAEKNYLEAIEKDTGHQAFFYVKLFEFYRYYSKKPDLAEKTLVEALKTNTNDAYLKSLLDEYRKEKSQ